MIKIDWHDYNERRYGKPWGALVSFDASGKPKYDFSAGRYLPNDADSSAGVLIIRAAACAIVATGQRDGRNPRNTRFQLTRP